MSKFFILLFFLIINSVFAEGKYGLCDLIRAKGKEVQSTCLKNVLPEVIDMDQFERIEEIAFFENIRKQALLRSLISLGELKQQSACLKKFILEIEKEEQDPNFVQSNCALFAIDQFKKTQEDIFKLRQTLGKMGPERTYSYVPAHAHIEKSLPLHMNDVKHLPEEEIQKVQQEVIETQNKLIASIPFKRVATENIEHILDEGIELDPLIDFEKDILREEEFTFMLEAYNAFENGSAQQHLKDIANDSFAKVMKEYNNVNDPKVRKEIEEKIKRTESFFSKEKLRSWNSFYRLRRDAKRIKDAKQAKRDYFDTIATSPHLLFIKEADLSKNPSTLPNALDQQISAMKESIKELKEHDVTSDDNLDLMSYSKVIDDMTLTNPNYCSIALEKDSDYEWRTTKKNIAIGAGTVATCLFTRGLVCLGVSALAGGEYIRAASAKRDKSFQDTLVQSLISDSNIDISELEDAEIELLTSQLLFPLEIVGAGTVNKFLNAKALQYGKEVFSSKGRRAILTEATEAAPEQAYKFKVFRKRQKFEWLDADMHLAQVPINLTTKAITSAKANSKALFSHAKRNGLKSILNPKEMANSLKLAIKKFNRGQAYDFSPIASTGSKIDKLVRGSTDGLRLSRGITVPVGLAARITPWIFAYDYIFRKSDEIKQENKEDKNIERIEEDYQYSKLKILRDFKCNEDDKKDNPYLCFNDKDFHEYLTKMKNYSTRLQTLFAEAADLGYNPTSSEALAYILEQEDGLEIFKAVFRRTSLLMDVKTGKFSTPLVPVKSYLLKQEEEQNLDNFVDLLLANSDSLSLLEEEYIKQLKGAHDIVIEDDNTSWFSSLFSSDLSGRNKRTIKQADAMLTYASDNYKFESINMSSLEPEAPAAQEGQQEGQQEVQQDEVNEKQNIEPVEGLSPEYETFKQLRNQYVYSKDEQPNTDQYIAAYQAEILLFNLLNTLKDPNFLEMITPVMDLSTNRFINVFRHIAGSRHTRKILHSDEAIVIKQKLENNEPMEQVSKTTEYQTLVNKLKIYLSTKALKSDKYDKVRADALASLDNPKIVSGILEMNKIHGNQMLGPAMNNKRFVRILAQDPAQNVLRKIQEDGISDDIYDSKDYKKMIFDLSATLDDISYQSIKKTMGVEIKDEKLDTLLKYNLFIDPKKFPEIK